jgi:hypothetical protein
MSPLAHMSVRGALSLSLKCCTVLLFVVYKYVTIIKEGIGGAAN